MGILTNIDETLNINDTCISAITIAETKICNKLIESIDAEILRRLHTSEDIVMVTSVLTPTRLKYIIADKANDIIFSVFDDTNTYVELKMLLTKFGLTTDDIITLMHYYGNANCFDEYYVVAFPYISKIEKQQHLRVDLNNAIKYFNNDEYFINYLYNIITEWLITGDQGYRRIRMHFEDYSISVNDNFINDIKKYLYKHYKLI